MKNFGKMAARIETVETETGPVPIYIFRDHEGIDLFDLAREFPHPFYIAVKDDGTIISMEPSVEQTQIAGYDIIGIDQAFGYTRGPGGTVYGRIWDGEKIVGASSEDIPPDEISRRQFFQYLAVIGIISKDEALAAMQGGVIPAPLQAIIDQLPTDDDQFNAQMFVVGAQNFNRLHWLTDAVRQAMEWTVEQRDDFWRGAAKL